MNASHDHHAGNDDDLIARAERVCAEKRLQFTPWRRRVFQELSQEHAPLGAYDLIDRLAGDRRVSPISVYRALDFLMDAGLVHRISARNTYLPCYHEHRAGEMTVFLVCTRCGSVEERTSHAVAVDLSNTAETANFAARSRSVELEGECSVCRGVG